MGLAAASRIAGQLRAGMAAWQLRTSAPRSIDELAARIDSGGDR